VNRLQWAIWAVASVFILRLTAYASRPDVQHYMMAGLKAFDMERHYVHEAATTPHSAKQARP